MCSFNHQLSDSDEMPQITQSSVAFHVEIIWLPIKTNDWFLYEVQL